MRNFTKWASCFLAVLIFAAACARTQPVDFAPGEFQCDHCGMSIVDMPYKAEIITPKGRIRHFDSIECLEIWGRTHPEELGSRWLSDFFHPGQWVALEKALILKSEKIPSPMGGHMAAFSSHDELLKAQQRFGGEQVILP